MAYGIKVSQTGHDVKTCDDKDLVFSSDWNTFKIKQSGIVYCENIPCGNYDIGVFMPGEKEVIIDHNLGYVPVLLAYADYGDGRFIINELNGLKDEYDGFKVKISSKQIFFLFENWSSTLTKNAVAHYFIFEELS